MKRQHNTHYNYMHLCHKPHVIVVVVVVLRGLFKYSIWSIYKIGIDTIKLYCQLVIFFKLENNHWLPESSYFYSWATVYDAPTECHQLIWIVVVVDDVKRGSLHVFQCQLGEFIIRPSIEFSSIAKSRPNGLWNQLVLYNKSKFSF